MPRYKKEVHKAAASVIFCTLDQNIINVNEEANFVFIYIITRNVHLAFVAASGPPAAV